MKNKTGENMKNKTGENMKNKTLYKRRVLLKSGLNSYAVCPFCEYKTYPYGEMEYCMHTYGMVVSDGQDVGVKFSGTIEELYAII